MSKAVSFGKYWLPVIIWMALIFLASSDALSSEHTSRILGPLLHWLFPNLSTDAVAEIVFEIRKLAHVMEYSLLALLLWRAFRQPVRRDPRPWNWTDFRLALLCSTCYAGTDEFHQLFVPSREGCVRDVAIDTAGAAAALVLLWAMGRWRKHW